MQALHFLLSPSGRLRPQPFIYGVAAVYVLGATSHSLTTPDVIARAGLWPFVAAQIVLIWVWFVLHAKRLRDAGRGGGLAAGASLLYALSIMLLLILATGFSNPAGGPMSNPNAGAALNLVVMLYVIASLAGTTPYNDIAWAIIAALTVLAFVPIVVAVAVTLWVATRPSIVEKV
jgi:uncharacterized membrane protein YhaH (DUF805 family)